ncbi:MAG: ABC transporter substrate-binding protein, partial [Acidimicrobiia bacterium]
MRSKRKWLPALIGLAVVAAACGGEAETTTQPPATQPPATQPPATEPPAAELLTDIGVDDTTIKVGLLADQSSGVFDVLVAPIVNASIAFWDKVNAEGGIADGRQVELVIKDTQYDPA